MSSQQQQKWSTFCINNLPQTESIIFPETKQNLAEVNQITYNLACNGIEIERMTTLMKILSSNQRLKRIKIQNELKEHASEEDENLINWIFLESNSVSECDLSCISLSSINSILKQLIILAQQKKLSNICKFRLSYLEGYELKSGLELILLSHLQLTSLRLCLPNLNSQASLISDIQQSTFVGLEELSLIIQSNFVDSQIEEKFDLIQVMLNKLFDIKALKSLKLSISQRIQSIENFQLLNQSLLFLKQVKKLSMDISYERMPFNIAKIIMMNPLIEKLKLNCSSSLNYVFFRSESKFSFQCITNLSLKLNFCQSKTINLLIDFLISQISTLQLTLKQLHLELSVSSSNQNDLNLKQIGTLLGQLSSIESLSFFNNNKSNKEFEQILFLIEKINLINNLKDLKFFMPIPKMNEQYSFILKKMIQRIPQLEINILPGIQIYRKDQTVIISNYIHSEGEFKIPGTLSYLIKILEYLYELQNLTVNIDKINEFDLLDVDSFIESIINWFPLIKIIILSFKKMNSSITQGTIKSLKKNIYKSRLLEKLIFHNNNFLYNNFRKELKELMAISIQKNLLISEITFFGQRDFVRDIKKEHFCNQIQIKSIKTKSLFEQLRVLKQSWPKEFRQQILNEMIQTFYI